MALGVAAAVGIAMGLIEWNARRQAAAMTAELMRPMTKSEQAAFDREMSKLDEQLARDLEAVMPRSVRLSAPAKQYAPPALGAWGTVHLRTPAEAHRGWLAGRT